jgi:formate dehydrogenase major subunit
LQHETSVTYTCLSEDGLGAPTEFIDCSSDADGCEKLVTADLVSANEQPNVDYRLY